MRGCVMGFTDTCRNPVPLVPLGNLHWVTKTTSGSSVIEMPTEVGQLYQNALVRGKGHIVPEPVAQRRRTSCSISGQGTARRTNAIIRN
jgi:hypothetical protein